ncbi:MAG: flagellar basal body rod protein FlgB [Spirochaetales bacterium]|nr:flagellar basal body rod protein FlgB [Spirochaetales bacterium]
MLNSTTFGRSVDLLQRNLSASWLRDQVISDNIANAETPNFKRSEVSFEAQLSRALASENKASSIGVTTHPKHISFDQKMDYQSVVPKITLDYLTTAKNNGNNVDIERETMERTKNQMMYEMMTYAVNHQFRQINTVLR